MPGGGAKNWCWTLNRRDADDDDDWATVIATTAAAGALDAVGYLVFQVERGENDQREHLQGYVQLKQRCSMSAVKSNVLKSREVHLEVAQGTPAQNKTYCTKDGRVTGPFEFGAIELVQQGRRTDIEEATTLLLAEGMTAVAEQMPATFVRHVRGLRAYQQLMQRRNAPTVRDEVAVAVLVGPTNIGKTWQAMTIDDPEHIYVLPVQNEGALWFDNYEGQRTLIIDDFDPTVIRYRTLLRILDRYRLDVPHKGTYVAAMWQVVIITANHHPSTWYLGLPGVDFYDDGPLERRLELIFTTNTRAQSEGFLSAFFLTFDQYEEDHLATGPEVGPEVAGNTEPQPRDPSHFATDAGAAPDDVLDTWQQEEAMEDAAAQDDSCSDTLDFEEFLTTHGIEMRDDQDYFSEDSVGF